VRGGRRSGPPPPHSLDALLERRIDEDVEDVRAALEDALAAPAHQHALASFAADRMTRCVSSAMTSASKIWLGALVATPS